jgi:hypothetical protein
LLFFETSFLIASHVFFLPMTMSAFAAYLIGLIATFIVGSIRNPHRRTDCRAPARTPGRLGTHRRRRHSRRRHPAVLRRALGQSTQIHHVLARHEQGGGFMAQGMARATGEPAVCLASSGPARPTC